MPENIVVVTAGGYISSFHAAMIRMHYVLAQKAPGKFKLIGASDGLEGLTNGNFQPIMREHLEEDKAGSLIGADRKIVNTGMIAESIRANGIYAVVMMAGDNHLREASKLFDAGIKIVGYPKTMDGDLHSGITLGYHTAVTVGAMATRNHHTDAMTSRRVFYVGLFGRNTDWVLAGVTAYGGADLGIPAERAYEWDQIHSLIESAMRENKGKYGTPFAVVPYSEGAKIEGVNEPPEEYRDYDAHGLPKLRPEWLGMELERLTKLSGGKAAFEAHTYAMRDSPPTETDKRLSRMAGEECIDMILDGDFGKSAVFVPSDDGFYRTERRPLAEVSVQRELLPTGFFNYDTLQVDSSFFEAYGPLFADLGVPTKDSLVFKNMIQ